MYCYILCLNILDVYVLITKIFMSDKSILTEKFALIPDNISSTQKTYFLLFKEHINLIRKMTQMVCLYNNEIRILEQNDCHKNELEWLKNVQQDLINQTDEHNGIAFILSKLNEFERKYDKDTTI